MVEEKELHPKMQTLLREAEEAYRTFLQRMTELDEERRRVYEKGVIQADREKINRLQQTILS